MLQRLGRMFKYYFLTLLRMQNSDHKIALGFAAGILPCWFPTMGIDILIAIALCRLISGNMVAAIAAASAGSILWPLLFFMNYKIGLFVRHLFTGAVPANVEEIKISHVTSWDYSMLAHYFSKLGHLGINFITGAIVNCIVSAFVFYGLSRLIMHRYRKPMLHKIKLSIKLRRKKCDRSKSL